MSKNPGKNIQGQLSRARIHHTGKFSRAYVTDTKKRRETITKRMKTVKENLTTLSKKTGRQMFLQWKDSDDGVVETFKTEGCTIGTDTSQADTFVVSPEVETEVTYPDPPTSSTTSVASNEVDLCKICKQKHIGNKRKCLWINCSERRCEYWAHALCVGLVGSNEELEQIKYFCPEHIKSMLSKKRK